MQQNSLPTAYQNLPEQEVLERIQNAKDQLGEKVVVLAHHYQRDDVFKFGDITGDSLKLSRLAAENKAADYIVFCGVHFMAETADIVNHGQRIVTLPDATAGCPMADTAAMHQVQKAWDQLQAILGDTICPVTYINSYASLKAFCGRHGGLVCTSTNAARVMDYAFAQKERIFFFPDQHLGRNVGFTKGVPLDRMVLFNPFKENGGLTVEELEQAKIILWSGCCPVHDRFKVEDIEKERAANPDVQVLVHPEVPFAVAEAADFMGSTEFIINKLAAAEPGSSWLVATEIHLVSRLAKMHPDKNVKLLGKPICMCSMMDRTSPEHLCWNLEELVKGNVVNQVAVEPETREEAYVSLERMLALK